MLVYTQFISTKGHKEPITVFASCGGGRGVRARAESRDKTLIRVRFAFHYMHFCNFLIVYYLFVLIPQINF